MLVQRLLVLVILLGLPALAVFSYFRSARWLVFIRRCVAVTFPLGILAFLGMSSCNARHSDVSNEERYATWIGRRCIVVNGLFAAGFTTDPRRRDVTSEVEVSQYRIGGSEITFTTPVPAGTTILVTGVRKCWNCPFDRIDYGIEIPEIPELLRYKVFAREEALGPAEATCTAGR
jgi:hypothetical protein